MTRHVRPLVCCIDMPSCCLSHVHINLVGPLCCFTHVFTIVDRSMCWPTDYPVQDTSTATCITALVEWISGFGVPATLTLDRGSQFTSPSWSTFCHSLGIEHTMTTAYHPQSNGMVERMSWQLKAALVARCSATSWPSELQWVLLGLRSVPLEDSGMSSAELVYGTPLSLPGQFLSTPELHDNLHNIMDPFVLPPLVHRFSPPLVQCIFCRCPGRRNASLSVETGSSLFAHTFV